MAEINIQQSTPQINIDTATRTYHLPIASETTLGGIKIGDNLSIESDGTLNAIEGSSYELPTASASTLGGVKVGTALSISDGVLSVSCDNTLSLSSSRPVQNSVITSEINSLTSADTGLDDRISDLETLTGNHTTAITANADDISTLNTTVGGISSDLTDLTSVVSGHTGNISTLDAYYNDLDLTVSGLQGDVEDLTTASGEISSDVMALKLAIDETISYTYLLPVSSWTSGQLTLHRRGNIAFLFANLAGSVLLGANDTTVIYTLTDESHIPLFTTSEPMVTDAGTVIMSVNDQGEVSLTNPSSSSITFTKLYGNVPLVY